MSWFSFFKKNLVYLAGLTVFVTSSFAISLIEKPPVVISKTRDFTVSKLPVLQDVDTFPVLSAQGIFAYDLDSGVVLYEKNPDLSLLPASTTKMVTGLVALDTFDMDEVLDVGTTSTIGSRMGLVWHEEMTLEDLLYGLLIHSANDAAEVIAANYPGGREAFIEAMNLKAYEATTLNTNFENPSGLDQPGQLTTARDMARIGAYAMKDERFASIVSTESRLASSADGKIVHELSNKNELLGRVEGVLGVKTGWTENARENLVTYVDRNGHKIVVALLGSQDRFGETEELVEWIYANYNWTDVKFDSNYSSL